MARLIRVHFVRQAYPEGGGYVVPEGAERDLTREQLHQYPRDSYRVIAQVEAEPPRTRYRTKG